MKILVVNDEKEKEFGNMIIEIVQDALVEIPEFIQAKNREDACRKLHDIRTNSDPYPDFVITELYLHDTFLDTEVSPKYSAALVQSIKRRSRQTKIIVLTKHWEVSFERVEIAGAHFCIPLGRCADMVKFNSSDTKKEVKKRIKRGLREAFVKFGYPIKWPGIRR